MCACVCGLYCVRVSDFMREGRRKMLSVTLSRSQTAFHRHFLIFRIFKVSSSASSRSQSRASSPCRVTNMAVPSIRFGESATPSRLQHHQQQQLPPPQHPQHSPRSASPGPRAPHCASPSRFTTVPSRSRNASTCRPDTRDASTQVPFNQSVTVRTISFLLLLSVNQRVNQSNVYQSSNVSYFNVSNYLCILSIN